MKILLTTEYRSKRDRYEYFSNNSDAALRIDARLEMAYGLRFIKQNLPQIEILEFPTWREFTTRVAEGWDIVGFSFFTKSTNRILEMVEHARGAGVGEIWGGGYGAMNPQIEGCFDRTFVGYAEQQIADALGAKIERLRHPPIIEQWRFKPLPFTGQRVGILFTSRGCPNRCAFCQSSVFAPKPEKMPLESIEEVLSYYRQNGVDWIFVEDETFGTSRKHTGYILELFKKYGMFWSIQTTAGNAIKNLDMWNRANLMGVGIGVESIDERALAAWNKKTSFDRVLALKERLYKSNRYLWSYYMLGHELADYESTLEEIETLRKHDLGYCQITVLTPFPKTPLWNDLDTRFGIFETDWARFDTKHLVWNHPHLTDDKLGRLQRHAFSQLNNSRTFLNWLNRIFRSYSDHLGSKLNGLGLMSSFPVKSYRYPTPPPLLGDE